MGEKFNSGHGGYICDTCRVLLWEGHKGHAQPERRQYIYRAEPDTVIVTENYAFCGELCLRKFNPDGYYPEEE